MRLRGEWSMAKGNTKPIARAESGRVYEILRVVRETLLLSFVHWGDPIYDNRWFVV